MGNTIKTEKIGTTKQTKTLKITGDAVTRVMCAVYQRKDFETLAELVPEMSVADAIAVCVGDAHVVGDNEEGLTVSYYDDEMKKEQSNG